jgi:hypothetical protein
MLELPPWIHHETHRFVPGTNAHVDAVRLGNTGSTEESWSRLIDPVTIINQRPTLSRSKQACLV